MLISTTELFQALSDKKLGIQRATKEWEYFHLGRLRRKP